MRKNDKPKQRIIWRESETGTGESDIHGCAPDEYVYFEDKRFPRSFFRSRSKRYLVPIGWLRNPIALLGGYLRTPVNSGEQLISIRPRFRIFAARNPERIYSILRDHYDDQLSHIEELLDNIFNRAIGYLSLTETIDGLANQDTAQNVRIEGLLHQGKTGTIPEAIVETLGLDVAWSLELKLEHFASEWVRNLKAIGCQLHTFEFSTKSAISQLCITYGMRVVGVSHVRWIAAQRLSKAASKGTAGVAQEQQELHNRIQDICDEMLSAFRDKVRPWEDPTFWPAVKETFLNAVSYRIEAELGYIIQFDFVTQERTAEEIQALGLRERPKQLLEVFTNYEEAYRKLLERRTQLALNSGHASSSAELKDVEAELAIARKRLLAAQQMLMGKSQFKPREEESSLHRGDIMRFPTTLEPQFPAVVQEDSLNYRALIDHPSDQGIREVAKLEKQQALLTHCARAEIYLSQQFGDDNKWRKINKSVWGMLNSSLDKTLKLEELDAISNECAVTFEEILAALTLLAKPALGLLKMEYIDQSSTDRRIVRNIEVSQRLRNWRKDTTRPEEHWERWAGNVAVQWRLMGEEADS